MARRTLTLEELKRHSLDEVLLKVIKQKETLIVRLPNGEEVSIEPRRHLKPLPELEGYVPVGWKNAVYNESKE